MSFEVMHLEDAIGAIETCQTRNELMNVLQGICEDYGFSSFNFLETGAPHIDIPFFMGTMDRDFSEDYFDNKLIHVDPCISYARRINTPFTWSDVSFPEYDVSFPEYNGIRKSGAQKTIEMAGDHGYKEGLVVPFHFSDKLARINSSLIVFFWKDSISQFNFTLSKNKHDLYLLMTYWTQRAIDLVGEEFHEGNRITTRQATSPCDKPLTDRERDILAWAARGKTAADTANILEVSEETVKTHIRNALMKLAATNKTHGVAKAIYLGLIDV